MSVFQRLVLAIAILEIPLQIDTYLLYHENDAEFGAIGGINLSLTTVALALLYAMWLVEAALQLQPRNRRVIWGVPQLIYIGIAGLSAVAAENWMLTLFEVTLLAQAYLLFFYLANRMESRSDVTFVVSVLGAAVAMQGMIIVGTSGMAGPREISLGALRVAISEDGRPTGTLLSPVLAGSFLALLIVPAGSLLVVPASKLAKALSIVAVVLGAMAIALTQTRGAIITMVVAAAVFSFCLLLRGWLPKWMPVAAVLIAGLIAIPLAHVFTERIQEGDGGSAEARVHLSKIAIAVIQDHPLLGSGAGNCHLAAQRAAGASPFRSEWYYTIHCKYLLVWVETGIVGLAAFLAFLLSTIAQGWRTWRLGDRLLSTISLAIVAGIVGHMVHMGVDVFNSRQQVQILWCCAGIIAGIVHLREAVQTEHETTEEASLPLITHHAA
ncbi:MAG: O-antigen ligase family protein [Planctomycetaceae bacterium]